MAFDEEYWTAARQRVAALGRIDVQLDMVFGSKGHKYQPMAPVAPQRLAAFEEINGVALPAEYRSFLSHFGAGGAGPDYGVFDFRQVESVSVRERSCLTQSQSWPEDEDDPLWNLPGMACLGTAGCSMDWFIEVNGPQPGMMWIDAGPGDQLMRCQSFGAWYDEWLRRVEYGLSKHQDVAELVKAGASLEEIAEQCELEPYQFTWDGGNYFRFKRVPGRIQVVGGRIVAFDVSSCWI